MLDSLPTEQKQPFIDHFVQTILGKPTQPLIQIKSFTISNDASIEEKIRLTASIYNIDPAWIDREDFERGEKEMTASKHQVMELIKEHYGAANTTGQQSKDDELISLGKFLYTTQMSYKIMVTEKPDFILTNDLETIGLEHTRLETETDKAYIAELWKKYLKDSLLLISTELPGLTGVANITLNADIPIYEGATLRNFKAKLIKDNISAIHRTLADYIISVITGKDHPAPSFVKTVTYQPSNEAFTLKYNQDFFVRSDFEKTVFNAIKKKENRLTAYNENTSLTACWLLLVYSEGGLSSGFKVNEDSLSIPVETSFDRIFILNSFNLACYEVSKTPPYLKYIAQKQFKAPLIKKPKVKDKVNQQDSI